MEKVYVITLDDGIDYVITDEMTLNGNRYIYLVQEENIENFCVRKVVKKNGEDVLIGLDNREEVEFVLKEFVKKHHP